VGGKAERGREKWGDVGRRREGGREGRREGRGMGDSQKQRYKLCRTSLIIMSVFLGGVWTPAQFAARHGSCRRGDARTIQFLIASSAIRPSPKPVGGRNRGHPSAYDASHHAVCARLVRLRPSPLGAICLHSPRWRRSAFGHQGNGDVELGGTRP